MKAVKLSVVSAAVLLSTSAMANVVTNTGAAVVDGTRTIFSTLVKPAAVSAEVGTLGYGANIAWAANEKTSLVAGWTGGDVTDLVGDDFTSRGVTYQVDTDLSNPYLGVQVRPAANWFTVSGGIIVPDNDVKVKALGDNGSYKIGGVVYDATQVGELNGTLEHRNKLAPYMTVGFRPTINNNWGVFGEVGAAYMGDTRANITAANNASVTGKDDNGNSVTNSTSTIANQAAAEIEDKNWGRWAPIAKVGVTYRF